MVINISVTDKRATTMGAPVIVCGNDDYTVKFVFDPEWAQYDAKTARFEYTRAGETKHQDVVFTGDTAPVPPLSGVHEVRVGVFTSDLRTTTPARVPCELSIRCTEGAPEDPTPSVYDQLMEKMNDQLPGALSAAERAEQAAERVKTAIDGTHDLNVVVQMVLDALPAAETEAF